MSEPLGAPGDHRRSGFGTLVWVVTFLPLHYALSISPVVRFFGGTLTPNLDAFYSPLEFLYEHVPPVHDFYEWYSRVRGIK